MIRLFASDLDGTLLGITHTVGSAVRSSIRCVTRSGAHFAVATGRTFRSNHDFGFDGLDVEVVCANGAIILGREGQVLRYSPLDKATLQALVEAFPAAPFDFVGRDHTYVRVSKADHDAANKSRRNPLFRFAARLLRSDEPEGERIYDCTNEQILAADICKANLRTHDETLIRDLNAFLDDHADHIKNAPFAPTVFELTDPAVNKGEAVAWLAHELGIGEDEVAVYGDGGNDVVMLERFAHSYAPRNAFEPALKAAHGKIGSNIFYAVGNHMKKTVRDQAGHKG